MGRVYELLFCYFMLCCGIIMLHLLPETLYCIILHHIKSCHVMSDSIIVVGLRIQLYMYIYAYRRHGTVYFEQFSYTADNRFCMLQQSL